MPKKNSNTIMKILTKARKTWFNFYLRALPVQKNTVFYHAYRNRIMSCNPYAIFLELIGDPNFKHYKHYWVYDSEEVLEYDTFKRHSSLPNVFYVKASTPKHLRAISTCEYVINNAAMPDYWEKKQGQIYINTWHGTPLKMLGLHAKDFKESSIRNAQRNFLIADYLVMPNRYTIEKILDSYDVVGMTPGTILDAGYPRNDLPINADSQRIRKLLENKFGEALGDRKVVLYAPTFRSENGISLDTSEVVISYIEEMLIQMPRDYVLFLKIHNTLGKYFRNNKTASKRLIFDEIDTNELLSATDVLITDYSSIFFDFLATKRPCLFFVYDRKEYETSRGLYLDIDSLPGALCYQVSDIIENMALIKANQYTYEEKETEYLKKFAYNDDGCASKRVVDYIFRGIPIDDKYIYSDHSDIQNVWVHFGAQFDRKKYEMLRYFLHTNDSSGCRVFLDGDNLPNLKEMDEFSQYPMRLISQHAAFAVDSNLSFNQYVNLSFQDEKNDLDSKFLAKNDIPTSALYFFEDASEGLDCLCKKYDKVTLICKNLEETEKAKERGCLPVHESVFDELARKTITFLFIAGTDSMNYVYVECIHEIQSRGHNAIVVVQDKADEVNNKPFSLSGIDTISIRFFNMELLNVVDVVFTPPVKFNAFNRLYGAIKNKGIFMVAFSNLFSSVAMRVYPDVLFTIGENKHDELESSHLKYNTIVTGNPQYDSLVRARKDNHNGVIEKILVIDQGGYPYGELGKKQFADLIVNMAINNPSMQFDIKPRYSSREISKAHHSVNEQLIDFIDISTENLSILTNDYILEELIQDYDAMIATWSTAYMAAVMMNIPLLLIEGFDSIDVFDVRVQRVEDAYNHLRKTGCLFHFTELIDKPIKFNYVNADYLEKEIYHYDKESAPNVIDFLEHYYFHFLKEGHRSSAEIFWSIEKYFKEWTNLETEPIGKEYFDEHCYHEKLNDLMQEAVYENRCMANMLDLDSLDIFYDTKYKNQYIDNYGRNTNQLVYDFKKVYLECKRKFFALSSNFIKIENDRILQDYYLEWLYQEQKYQEIFKPQLNISALTSLEYYRALASLNGHKRRAYFHLNNYLRLLMEEPGPKQLLKEKNVSIYTLPFRRGKCKILFYYYLLKYNNMNSISRFPENVTRKNPILTYLLMLDNNRHGNYSISLNVYSEYFHCVEERQLSRKKRGIKGRSEKNPIKYVVKKMVYLMMRKEYRVAKNYV